MIVEEFQWPIDKVGKLRSCVIALRRNEVGPGVDDSKGEKTVVVVIPGNPGPPQFYRRLMEKMLEISTPDEVDEIYCLGHTGHTSTDNVWQTFSYTEQTSHKLYMLRNKIFGRKKKLVLIGHSIGAWICTDLMRQFQEIEQSKIRAVVCLFPTLMHIGKSPNGQSLGPLIGNYYVREFSAIVVNLLRKCCLERLLSSMINWMQGNVMDYEDAKLTVEKLIHPYVVRNAMYMGDTEMKSMGEIDSVTIRRHADKFFFYFGPSDGWTQPIDEHLMKVREAIGSSTRLNDLVRVDTNEIPHACTLGPSYAALARILIEEYMRGILKQ